jgi:hypothetical protein
MKNKKHVKTLILIGVLLVISIVIGISYAYFMISHTQEKNNIAGTGCISLSFTEANDITLSNQFPISDADGKKLTPYTFSVTNTCTMSVGYDINMEVLNTTTADTAYIKTNLNNNTKILNTYPTITTTLAEATSAYNMSYNYNLASGDTRNYELRIWIDKDAPTSMQNKLFESKIVITAYAAEMYLKDKLLLAAGGKDAIAAKAAPDFSKIAPYPSSYKDNDFSTTNSTASISTTLQGKYVTYADSYTFDTATGLYSLTSPTTALYSTVYASLAGKYLATTSQSGSSAFSYSSSGLTSSNIQYIFKAVSTPYDSANSITFTYNKLNSTYTDASAVASYDPNSSGMWQAADKHSKENKYVYYYRGAVTNNNVLYDNICWKVIRINSDDTIRMIYNGVPVNGECTQTGEDTIISASAFNTTYNDNAYVGFEYGTAGSSTYNATHTKTNSSTIKTAINSWVTTNFNPSDSDFGSSYFCNDRSLFSGTGIGTTNTEYGAVKRMNTNSPSLICPNGNDKNRYIAGLITVDELVMAGATSTVTPNTQFYLNSGVSYWSMTPAGYYDSFAANYALYDNGTIHTYGVDTKLGVRPVINLGDGIYLSGDGTINSPYKASGDVFGVSEE